MNEGDFDKIISKKLKEEVPVYPNLDANWQKVKDKMALLQDQKPSMGGVVILPNSGNNTGQRKWLVPTLLGALLLMLGSNGWLVWHLSQTQNNNTQLTTEKQKTIKTLYHTDTIVETRVIYKTDTIYQKVVVYQTLVAQPSDYADKKAANNTPSVSPIESPNKRNDDNTVHNDWGAKGTSPYSVPHQPTNSNGLTVSIQQTSLSTPFISDVKKQTTDLVTPKQVHNHTLVDSIQSPQMTITDSLDTKLKSPIEDTLRYTKTPFDSLEIKPTISLQPIIKTSPKKIIVDHYALGIQGGFSGILPKVMGVDIGKWLGVAGEMAFKNGVCLSLSLDNSKQHFKTTIREALTNLPKDPPMTENYKLKYVEGKMSTLQAGIGISYHFMTEKKIKPFISAGYARRWLLPQAVEFEFTNKKTGEDKSFHINDKSYHQDSWFNIGMGMETAFNTWFSIRLKTEYIIDPNHGLKPYNHVLLRGGIFYKF
jgi:hypothetical protein